MEAEVVVALRWRQVGVQEVVAYVALATLTAACAHLLAQVVLPHPPAAAGTAFSSPGAALRPEVLVRFLPAAHPAAPAPTPPAAAPTPPSPAPALLARSSPPPASGSPRPSPAPTALPATSSPTGPRLLPSSAGHGALPDRPVPEIQARVDLAQVRMAPLTGPRPPRAGVVPPTAEAGAAPALVDTRRTPVSTFSTDGSTGSWRAVREALSEGRLPAPELVRAEDLVNAQDSDVPPPAGDAPVAVDVEAAPHPWHEGRHLLRVGLRAAPQARAALGPATLTVLVDTSGSMALDGRLSHVQAALHGLVAGLGESDRLTLVSYADQGRVLVDAAGPARSTELHGAIDALRADGASAQAEGLESAWRAAGRAWTPGTDQRVVLFTDGEANLGVSELDPLGDQAASWAGRGLRLDVVTVGLEAGSTDGGDDTRIVALARRGGGRLWTLRGFEEAQDLPARLRGTEEVAPQEVEVAVAFDPGAVSGWRLVGHEGGSGQAPPPLRLAPGRVITALYELAIVPAALAGDLAGELDRALAEIHLSATQGVGQPTRWTVPVTARAVAGSFQAASRDLRVAAAAARFAALLLHPTADLEAWAAAAELAAPRGRANRPQDAELARLIRQSGRLAARPGALEPRAQVVDPRDALLLDQRLLRAQASLDPCATASGQAGHLALALQVEGGAVVRAEVHHDGGDPGLERCAGEVVRTWRFPSAWRAHLDVPVVLARR